MGVKLRWNKPDSESGYDTVYIYRASSEAGSYSQIATQSVTDNTYYDTSGSSSYWYKVRFYDSINSVYSQYSSPLQGGDTLGYVSVDEARNILMINESEYSDNQLQKLILFATDKIDKLVGRTWQAVSTVSNMYLDGNGNTFLDIPGYTDIVSITALAIREDGNSSFTTVTPSYVHLYSDGRIALDTEAYPGVEVSYFPKGFKNIRISFTYGSNSVPYIVKELTLLLISQTLSYDKDRQDRVNEIVNLLKSDGLSMP